MFHSEHLQEKWAPLLDYQGLDSIKDSHRRSVTAVLLENQERFLKEQAAFDSGSMGNLMEATPTNAQTLLVHPVVLVVLMHKTMVLPLVSTPF